MSEESVEIVRAAYEAWTSGGPEAARSFAATDIEVHDPPEFPDAAVHRGIDAAVERWSQWQEAWGDMPLEIRKLVPVGDEVIVVVALQVEGARSGVGLSGEVAHAVLVRNGKLARQRTFFSEAAALEAAGLA